MTIRQIAEAAGCSINTVRPVARNMFPEVKAESRGLPIDYDRDQSIAIMAKLPKRNDVTPSNIGEPTPTKMEGFGESPLVQFMVEMQKQNQAFMMKVLERLDALENRSSAPLQIESHLSLRDQLRAIHSQFSEEKADGNFREAWHILYRELYYRKHVNVKVRAKNTGKKKLDVIEDSGLLDDSIAIFQELLR